MVETRGHEQHKVEDMFHDLDQKLQADLQHEQTEKQFEEFCKLPLNFGPQNATAFEQNMEDLGRWCERRDSTSSAEDPLNLSCFADLSITYNIDMKLSKYLLQSLSVRYFLALAIGCV